MMSSLLGILQGAFSTLVEYPLRTLGVLAVTLTVAGAFLAGKRYGEANAPVTEVRKKDRPLTEDDLLDPSLPDLSEVYSRPDSTVVETTWVRIPDFVTGPSSAPDTVVKWRSYPSDIELEAPSIPGLETDVSGLPDAGFYILPLTAGTPAISVSPEVTRVQVFHPRTSQGIGLTYQHPDHFLEVGPVISAGVDWTGQLKPRGTIGAWAGHSAWRVRAGFRFDSRAGLSGFTVGTVYEPTLFSLNP